MNETKAKRMFEQALATVHDRADWADTPMEWSDLDESAFLAEYCWAVFTCGFNPSTVRKYFEKLRDVFQRFEPTAIACMSNPRREDLPIRHTKKANGFLRGAKLVHKEGWNNFKVRLEREGIDALQVLPWIGDGKKYHLAKSIGLADVANPDPNLVWCANHCDAESVDQLVAYLASEYQMTRLKVDAVLWEWRRST